MASCYRRNAIVEVHAQVKNEDRAVAAVPPSSGQRIGVGKRWLSSWYVGRNASSHIRVVPTVPANRHS